MTQFITPSTQIDIIQRKFPILFEEIEQNSKENLNDYYTLTLFVETLRKAYGFEKQYKNDIFPILVRWNKLLMDETKYYRKYDYIDETECFQNSKIHLKEIIKLLNIGNVFKTRYKMKPYLGLALALGILYGTLIFEPTMIDLSIEKIYSIIPVKKQTRNGLKTFKKDFFAKGMSDEIRKILYSTKL